MRSLDKKTLRDCWRLRGQVIAIALVVAAGVAVLSMALGAQRSLEETLAAYYERGRFAQVFARAERAPESLVHKLRHIPGVQQIETRIVKSALLDVAGLSEPASAHVVSVPRRGLPTLNDLVIREGRRVHADDPSEAVISETFAEENALHPGDRIEITLNGRKRTLKIVGTALSPEFIYAIPPGGLLPDDRRFGIVWMGRAALAAAFDLEAAFNDVTLTLMRDAREESVIAALDDALEPYGGFAAHGRDDQFSHAYITGEIEELRALSRVLPPIFMAVAAFLLNIVAARLIETEREQIGLLKACGYGATAIGWHYGKFVLVVAVLGLVLGFLAGGFLGRFITEIYASLFNFPFLHYRPGIDVYVIAALVTLGAASAGGVLAVSRGVRLPAAEAMRPRPPPVYHGIGFLPAVSTVWFGPSFRMAVRNIVRWPLRSGLTVVGIALAQGILVASLFVYDSVDDMIDAQFYRAQRQDVTVSFVQTRPDSVRAELANLPGVLAVEPYRAVRTRLVNGARMERRTIHGLMPGATLHRTLDNEYAPLPLAESGIQLTAKLAELLKAGLGDAITVEVLEAERPVRRLNVSAILDEPLGTQAYMARPAITELMGETARADGAYLLVDADQTDALYAALKGMPGIAGIALRSAALDSIEETLAETMDVMITFYVTFGVLIAFGIVYNSARVSLSEHGRDLASLRVLGLTRGEVFNILLGQLAILTAVALAVGCLVGWAIAWLMTQGFDSELFRIRLVITPATMALAALITLGAAAVSVLLVKRRLDALDLIAVLKTRE